jgi:hypothetical protein
MTDINDSQKPNPPVEKTTVNNIQPSKKKNSLVIGGIIAGFLVFLLGFGLGFTSGALSFGHHNDRDHSRYLENHRSGVKNEGGPHAWNNGDNNKGQTKPAPDKLNNNRENQKLGTKEVQPPSTKTQTPSEETN